MDAKTESFPEKYEIFGGLLYAYLVFFYVYLVAALYQTVFQFVNAAGWLQKANYDAATVMLLVSFAVVGALKVWICVYTIVRMKKRERATPKKIVRHLALYALIYGIVTAFQFALIFVTPTQTLNFFTAQLSELFQSILFLSLSIFYFMWSRHVKYYYTYDAAPPETTAKSPSIKRAKKR